MACCSGDIQFVKDILRIPSVRQQLELNSYVPLREVAEYQKFPHCAEVLDAILLPFHIAAVFGHIEIVELCLDMGIDISATFNLTFDGDALRYGKGTGLRKETNWTALMAAARNGWSNTVMLLVDRGADVLAGTTTEEAKFDPETALSMAARKCYYSCLLPLVSWYNRRNCPLNESGKRSAVREASTGGNTECIRLLLQHGSDVNDLCSHGYTPVIRAAQYGHFSAIKVLTQHDADLNARTKKGYTALMAASMYGYYECMQTLLQFGADITLASTEEGYTAIHYAAKNGHAKCVALLVRYGGDINRQTPRGDTPLDCLIINQGLQSELKSECQKSLETMGATSGRPR
jgi:ankyrin repeat protein